MKRFCLCGTWLNTVLILIFALVISPTYAAKENFTASNMTSFIYFTGIGCPHCANVDPLLLKKKVRESNLLVIEYEIYQDSPNAPLLMAYNSQFGTALGIPMIIADSKKDGSIVGDTTVLTALDAYIEKYKGNNVVLPSGLRSFSSLSLSDLPHLPKLWFKNRVAIKKDDNSKESDTVKAFLIDNILPEDARPIQERTVALSDHSVTFREAFSFGGWILMRN
ncbi:MAG: hypothetical protein PHD48_03535 [Alphaproteobacteria bacterium]|nr:hypothetical protein [Alphaproteobacteria bacterium]